MALYTQQEIIMYYFLKQGFKVQIATSKINFKFNYDWVKSPVYFEYKDIRIYLTKIIDEYSLTEELTGMRVDVVSGINVPSSLLKEENASYIASEIKSFIDKNEKMFKEKIDKYKNLEASKSRLHYLDTSYISDIKEIPLFLIINL